MLFAYGRMLLENGRHRLNANSYHVRTDQALVCFRLPSWAFLRLNIFAIVCFLLAIVAPASWITASDITDEKALSDFFERKVRPLIAKRCYECHSSDTASDNGSLALDSRAGLLAGGTRGAVLIAGKPDESLLIHAVRYLDPKLQMPPEGKMPAEEIEILAQWVQSGGFVPEYGTAVQKKGKEIDWQAARQFWSFQPLHPKVPPQDVDSGTSQQPIDAFIRQCLAQHDLLPAVDADRRTLIRRLSFDLIGLPPSFEEVNEFVAETRPDSYERLADRLLASPHFGERWARYWLDLARYTDVTPSWLNNADQAWLFRDWIINSINQDLPYDLFVKQQLAADVIEDSRPENYAALGYIGLSPTYWKELKLAPDVIEIIVADEWDERIDAVSRTFLGLTVSCARCHDHKFDPITVRDYYGLAGVFASTQLTDRPLLASPLAEQIAEARQQVDKLDEKLKALKDKDSDDAKSLQAQIEAIREFTPRFDTRMAHVVEEASLFVLPDGPDATKLDVRKNQPRDLPVYRRGNPGNPGEIVPRRFLEVLTPTTPTPFASGSGRRQFAEALFQEARSLTARVMVNRVWSNHFGRGLVRTPSDFGAQGDRPTHPELLEWLAAEFSGQSIPASREPWSLKRLHRLMVTSATYRQSSDTSVPANGTSPGHRSFQLDPDNHWLARMSRRRQDIEPWRDSMLVASGNFDDTLGGPAIELDLPTNHRRTLYGKVGRDEQNDMLRLYDFPPPTSHSPARDQTTTPLQQLFVLNSEFVENQAIGLTNQIQSQVMSSSVSKKVSRCYEVLLQRSPSEKEQQQAVRFLTCGNANEATSRFQLYVQSLFGLNELMFVD